MFEFPCGTKKLQPDKAPLIMITAHLYNLFKTFCMTGVVSVFDSSCEDKYVLEICCMQQEDIWYKNLFLH